LHTFHMEFLKEKKTKYALQHKVQLDLQEKHQNQLRELYNSQGRSDEEKQQLEKRAC